MPDEVVGEIPTIGVWPVSERRLHEIERLSRALCLAWGWDPDRPNGVAGKTWQSMRVSEHVLAYIAMRNSDAAAVEVARG